MVGIELRITKISFKFLITSNEYKPSETRETETGKEEKG